MFLRVLYGGQSLLEDNLETSEEGVNSDDTSSNENVEFQNDTKCSSRPRLLLQCW